MEHNSNKRPNSNFSQDPKRQRTNYTSEEKRSQQRRYPNRRSPTQSIRHVNPRDKYHPQSASRENKFRIGYSYLEATSKLNPEEVTNKLTSDIEALGNLLNDTKWLTKKPDWVLLLLRCLSQALDDSSSSPVMVQLIAERFLQTSFVALVMIPKFGTIYGKGVKEIDDSELECVRLLSDILARLLRRTEGALVKTAGYIPSFQPIHVLLTKDSMAVTGASNSSDEESITRKVVNSIELLNRTKEEVQLEKQKNEEKGLSILYTRIKELTILPTTSELTGRRKENLKPMKKSYASLREYLYTVFCLLRDDFSRPLSLGIRDYRKSNGTGSLSSFRKPERETVSPSEMYRLLLQTARRYIIQVRLLNIKV